MTILKYYNLSWLTAALPWHTTQHSWQVGNRIVRMRQSWHSCLTNMTWQPWHDRTQSHEQLKITSWLQWLTWHGNMITMSWPRDNHARTMWQPWQCNGTVKSKQSVTLLFFSTYGCQNLNLFSFLYAIFYIVIPCRRTEIIKHNITLNYVNMFSNKSIILLKH